MCIFSYSRKRVPDKYPLLQTLVEGLNNLNVKDNMAHRVVCHPKFGMINGASY